MNVCNRANLVVLDGVQISGRNMNLQLG